MVSEDKDSTETVDSNKLTDIQRNPSSDHGVQLGTETQQKSI